jgi:hypothetical protein
LFLNKIYVIINTDKKLKRRKNMGKEFPENIKTKDQLIENKNNKNSISRIEILF